MKIVTIVGARPQFIKAAMLSRAISNHNRQGARPHIVEEIIHTGQHHDQNMSKIFFRQMGICKPAVNLNINGGSHGVMTGRMLPELEREIMSRKPDWVLVYGDTNSTLAGALAAAKLSAPVAHMEAGLRSFNRSMPEEINRVLTDHISSLLLCPTHAAVANLTKEGIVKGVCHVGDVMYDAALMFAKIAEQTSTILTNLNLTPKAYMLATVHRAENTEDPLRLKNILTAFSELALPVVFPVHPRTRQKISEFGLLSAGPELQKLKCIAPTSFLDMVQLEKNAKCILTDSGGVQKESYFHGVPCVTLRDETEWVETVAAGWNQVVGTDEQAIHAAVARAAPGKIISDYGQGNSASQALHFLIENR